ncbi:MAG TPA: YIP1 family protein [Acidimicrobiia bacterium]|nr:YIP1 family protein [Acidimicrobiia bacterium]
MQKIFSRALRGAMLDRKAFAEVFWDDDATADGVIVVALVAAASFVIVALTRASVSISSIPALLQTTVSAVASWLILAAATWFAATKMFKTGGGIRTMMATHGLAYLPTIAFVIPFAIAAVIGLVWYIAVLTRATQEAVSSNTKTAFLAVLVGFAFMLIIQAIFRLPFTAASALFGLF